MTGGPALRYAGRTTFFTRMCLLVGAATLGVAVAGAGPARAACDVAGEATALAAARAAIDAECPCAAALSRGIHRRCARDVVRARLLAGTLASGCRREALRHATQSICGRPDAVVCCRVRADGRTRHRVRPSAAACTSSSGFTSCASAWPSVPTGCDAAGCIPAPPPVCGNGVVEAGEQCDPPDVFGCSATCQAAGCVPAPGACGNGVVDAGEACEPPGAGGCYADCQPAPCAPAAAGEIEVACVAGTTSVGAAATASAYLLAWTGPQRRAAADVLVRRFDAAGTPLDAAPTVVSEEACTAAHGDPAVGADGAGFYAAWSAFGGIPESGAPYEAIFGRRVGPAGAVEPLDQLAFLVPFGQCRTDIGGPTAAAGMAPARFAVAWRAVASCFPGGAIAENPVGVVLDFGSPPSGTSVPLGFPIAPPPNAFSTSGARTASLGADTLWAWHVLSAQTTSGPFSYFVAGVWTDAAGSTGPVALTTRRPFAAGRPALAAGTASLLVAWAQAASDTAFVATEIRGLRVTRAAGALDPAGGRLLATTAAAVTGGPTAAFDGTRWLVAWAQAAGATHDLYGVAVAADGTPVDPAPRLLAADVGAREPAAASAGDGRVLVVYDRPAGAASAVRATLVVP